VEERATKLAIMPTLDAWVRYLVAHTCGVVNVLLMGQRGEEEYCCCEYWIFFGQSSHWHR